MPYVVIKDFTDLQDENHIYHAGDKFPHKGRAKKERIDELTGSENLRGQPLIQEEEGES